MARPPGRERLLAEVSRHFVDSLSQGPKVSIMASEVKSAISDSIARMGEKLKESIDKRHRQRVVLSIGAHGKTFAFGWVLENSNLPQMMAQEHIDFLSTAKDMVLVHQKLSLELKNSPHFARQSKLLDQQGEEFKRVLEKERNKPIQVGLIKGIRDEIFTHAIAPFCPEEVHRTYNWVLNNFSEQLPSLLREAGNRRGE